MSTSGLTVAYDERGCVAALSVTGVDVALRFETVSGDHDYNMVLWVGEQRFVLWAQPCEAEGDAEVEVWPVRSCGGWGPEEESRLEHVEGWRVSGDVVGQVRDGKLEVNEQNPTSAR